MARSQVRLHPSPRDDSLRSRAASRHARPEDRVRSAAAAILAVHDGDSWSVKEIIGHLGQAEELWLGRLAARVERLDPAVLGRRVLYPQLNQRIRVPDLMVFAAEHDDRHLARIAELLRLVRRSPKLPVVLAAQGARSPDSCL